MVDLGFPIASPISDKVNVSNTKTKFLCSRDKLLYKRPYTCIVLKMLLNASHNASVWGIYIIYLTMQVYGVFILYISQCRCMRCLFYIISQCRCVGSLFCTSHNACVWEVYFTHLTMQVYGAFVNPSVLATQQIGNTAPLMRNNPTSIK